MMVGKNILHYRILEKIGAGGQGTVYKAQDTKLGRTVVVKVLPPELHVNKVNLKRFEREAHLASSLDHSNICTIFDMGEAGDLQFIAMQHVEGHNVRELVKGHPLELRSALSIAIQVCDALAAAHARGIIHRDIKANNVMVTEGGHVKVLDFGLAKLLDEEAAHAAEIHHTQLTEVGVPYGTATYAAPEQAQGLAVDTRADIFSTGVLLYEMLTGTWPFRGKTTLNVRYAVVHETPRPLAEARPEPTPPRLQEILDRALQKDPQDRYQTIVELRDDLRAVLHDISLASDPQFVEEVLTSVPHRLDGTGPASGGAERLSVNFRFHKGGKELDNKARFDLDRIADFLTELKLTGQNLLLFGFADEGDGSDTGLALSKERALAVAQQLKRRGVAPAVVEGFGASLPVASSATEEGQDKNRRVEIRLKQ